MLNSSIWLIDRTLSNWTWGQCQWTGTLHFTKLQHYQSFTIRLFIVISRTLMVGVLPIWRDAVSVFYPSLRLLGHRTLIRRVLLLCRYTVGVFYPSPTLVGHRSLIGGDLLICRYPVDVFYSSPSLLGLSWVYKYNRISQCYGQPMNSK